MEYVTYSLVTGDLTGYFIQDLHPQHKDCYVEVDKLDNWTSYKYDTETKSLEKHTPEIIPVIPQSVPMRSARLILLRAGLLKNVQSYIDNLTGEGAEEAKINWEFAMTVQRSDKLVKQLIPSLGKSEQEIDQMFIDAAKL